MSPAKNSAASGKSLGIAGRLTSAFIASPLTPLLLIAALALGLIALVTLPREEEPQISVPMVDIMVRADGLKAEDAVKLVTEPLETIVKSINGVEHVYSRTYDDQVVVTVRFLVGTSTDAAILRVHDKVRANLDRIPTGVPEPLIVGRGIDDVAIVVLTLAPKPEVADRWRADALTDVARELRTELAKLEDVGLTYLAGDQPTEIRVEPDPEALARYGVTLQQLAAKVQGANSAFQRRTGARQRPAGRGRRRPHPANPAGNRQSAADHPRQPPGLCPRRRQGRGRCRAQRNPRGRIFRRDANGGFSATPTVSIAIAKRAGRQCRGDFRAHRPAA